MKEYKETNDKKIKMVIKDDSEIADKLGINSKRLCFKLTLAFGTIDGDDMPICSMMNVPSMNKLSDVDAMKKILFELCSGFDENLHASIDSEQIGGALETIARCASGCDDDD